MKEVREEDIAPSAPHEKKAFLIEYEGPTQLYRLLNHRHEVDPTFLYRNINYERIKKKTKKGKENGTKSIGSKKIEKCTEKLMLSAQPVRPTEILCMQFNGITGVEKAGREFVQVKIEFRGIPAAKRKQEPEQVLWKRETVLLLNPKKGSFSEMVKIPINEIEAASKLAFKIEFPKADPNEKVTSQSDTPVQEPSPTAPPRKRTKLTSQNSESGSIIEKAKRNRTKLNGICMAVMELDMPIKEGDYEITVEQTDNGKPKEKKSDAREANKTLHWETVSGGQSWAMLEQNLPLCPQVRFTMSWSEAISHIRLPKRNITSKKPIEEIKIIYQFYYQNRARVLNETRSSSSCVWCEKQLFTVSNLLTHLNASHDRFLYSTPELKAIQSKMKIAAVHIEVYPNPLKTHSYLGNPNLSDCLDIGRCLFHHGSGPIKRTNTAGTQVIIWKGNPIHISAKPDERGELDRSECSLITQGHRRLYFHTHSNMPVRACEFDVDSEDDSTDEFRWIRENMFNQINEFTDVNKDEKLVMQLWNHHVMSRKVLSLNHIYESCKEISLKYSNFILKKNLRRNFLLHLLNLVDHSLLKPSKVPEIMETLDLDQGEEEPDFLGLNAERYRLMEIIEGHNSTDQNYFL